MTALDMAKVIFEGVKSLKPKEDRNLIAIAGPPGSGKSTVAEIVADLMNKNPKRFVLALDNVWDGHWLKGYSTRINIWRKALSSLDKQAALLIACGNANDYFKLEIKCLEERP